MIWSADVFWTYLADPRIVAAAGVTILVATAAQTGATAIGFVLALGMRSRVASLRLAVATYVWLFRGTPPLVLLLLAYFGLPQLGIRLGVLEAGLICLSMYSAAYMAEIVRAALGAIDRGQVEAARSLGMSRAETMRSILLPQAIRLILPPFGNEFASMMRTTSLLSVISFEEVLRATNMIINQTFRPLELYAVAALWYLAMATAWMAIQAVLERRAALDPAPGGGRLRLSS